jgi:hypothetical protein
MITTQNDVLSAKDGIKATKQDLVELELSEKIDNAYNGLNVSI